MALLEGKDSKRARFATNDRLEEKRQMQHDSQRV